MKFVTRFTARYSPTAKKFLFVFLLYFALLFFPSAYAVGTYCIPPFTAFAARYFACVFDTLFFFTCCRQGRWYVGRTRFTSRPARNTAWSTTTARSATTSSPTARGVSSGRKPSRIPPPRISLTPPPTLSRILPPPSAFVENNCC